MIETVVRVGIADTKVIKAPSKIKTLGLGSCVGVVIYDSMQKTAGLTHIMLPDSSIMRETERINRAKFANTAIDDLYAELIKMGCNARALKAKIAGGAQMFQFSSNQDQMRIGTRNIQAVKDALKKYNIPIISEDIGGNIGRTIEFDVQTTELSVRKAYHDTITI